MRVFAGAFSADLTADPLDRGVPQRVCPDRQHHNLFDTTAQHGQGTGKVSWSRAGSHSVDPGLPEEGPVCVHKGGWNIIFQLKDCLTKSCNEVGARTMHRTDPFEGGNLEYT